ncbi:MAG: molybdopterin-dependent oxidoreductase [Gemmatimonas sp.]|nr:molybdopterin-dependent oxidoreductase [Gemmatimonas sp.]
MAGASLERFVYDEEGNPLVTSFMDYLMPTAAEAPEMQVILTEDTPTKNESLGREGGGRGRPYRSRRVDRRGDRRCAGMPRRGDVRTCRPGAPA